MDDGLKFRKNNKNRFVLRMAQIKTFCRWQSSDNWKVPNKNENAIAEPRRTITLTHTQRDAQWSEYANAYMHARLLLVGRRRCDCVWWAKANARCLSMYVRCTSDRINGIPTFFLFVTERTTNTRFIVLNCQIYSGWSMCPESIGGCDIKYVSPILGFLFICCLLKFAYIWLNFNNNFAVHSLLDEFEFNSYFVLKRHLSARHWNVVATSRDLWTMCSFKSQVHYNPNACKLGKTKSIKYSFK